MRPAPVLTPFALFPAQAGVNRFSTLILALFFPIPRAGGGEPKQIASSR